MIKKSIKYFVITIALLLISTLSVSAREVTVDTLGEQIDKLEDKYNENIDSYYIIGNYVFTSHYKLDTKDIMLAARSIVMNGDEFNGNNLDTALNKMTIHEVERTFDNNYKPTGWKILKNYVGKTELKETTKFNIKYIDYSYLKELYTVTLNTDGADYKNSISVEEGELIKESSITGTNAPKKDGYVFKEWVKEDGKTPWNFDEDKVTENTTLKATWYKEVNTDTLLEQAEEAMVENEYYGVKFDKEHSKLIFTVYDKNEKNSLISGTGITGNIVALLKDENVVSIKFGNATITKEDLKNGGGNPAGPTGSVWTKFGEALKDLTGKSDFNEVTLGDLIGKNLKLEITVNETTARTHKENISETYNIEFVYNAGATLSTEIPENEKADLLSKFNYTPESTYNIEGENGSYTVKGYVTEKNEVKGFGNKASHYYFAYTIKLDDGVDLTKVKVQIPKGPKSGDGYNVANGTDFVNNQLTVLMEVEESEETQYRDIIVNIDGVPTKIRIDFKDLKLEKSSTFTIEKLEDETDPFNTTYGWEANDGYDTTFTKVDGNPHQLKVTGLLPIFSNEDWDQDPFNPGYGPYYLGFVVKLGKDIDIAGSSDKISVKFLHDDQEEEYGDIKNTLNGEDSTRKAITKDDFDGSKTLYVLKYINPNDQNKKFDVTIDLDGEDGDVYGSYTITLDWSELKFQQDSNSGSDYEIVDPNKIDANDKTTLEDTWGFNFSLDDISYITESQPDIGEYHKGLQGTIKQQTLNKAVGFKELEGYYVPVKITVPKDLIPNEYWKKWTISLKTEDGSYRTVTPSETDYNNGYIVVLYQMKYNEQNITYKIDYDGTGNDYLESDEIKIPTNFTYLSENHLTYKYKDNNGKDQIKKVKVYENETVTLENLGIDTDYRKFDKWNTSRDISGEFKTNHDEDLELTAYWKLNVDKFVNDVVNDLNSTDTTNSNNFENIIDLEQTENEITINIDKPNVKLEELAKTSIPGTIAYVLEKNEIKDVTLQVGTQSKTFDSKYEAKNDKEFTDESDRGLLNNEGKKLKEEIVKGAKEAFDGELNEHESDATLDQLEYSGKTFTLKIGDVDSTVTLVDNKGDAITSPEDKTYTFKFDSDFAVVNQSPTSELGAKTIQEAVAKENNYSTVYIDDTDYNESKTIDINTNHGVSIKPIPGAENTTITATGESVKYAVDVKSGNVTFENLKITGGKKAQLKVEDGANVTVNNIDVSGKIDSPETSKDGKNMTASILVEGILTASNIINNDESYINPTIALVTGDTYPGNITGEDQEEEQSGDNFYPNAKVTANDMKKNSKYSIVDKTNSKIHSIKETYYGSFYYTNPNNSQLYFLAIMDLGHDGISPYDYIQIYYYDEKIDFIEKLNYEIGKTENDDNTKVLKNFTLKDKGEILGNGTEKAQDKLKSHDTNVVYANYEIKKSASISLQSNSELSAYGNRVSGTLTNQNKEGKYIIPISLNSEKFNESTTVKVIDPNGNTNNYKYSDGTENGIATVSTQKMIKLDLEAIKLSKITGEKGKLYTIELDIDGNNDAYKPETYTIDYSNVTTLEEKINNASKNTQDANSLTIIKNNKIKNSVENFTLKYDKTMDVTLYSENNEDKEYTFRLKNVVTSHNGPIIISVRKSKSGENRPTIGDWEFSNFFKEVSKGYHEISLLQDVMKNTTLDAIKKVEKIDNEDHKYKVTLNKDRLNEWLDNAYISGTTYDETKKENPESGTTDNENVIIEVELDSTEQYLVSMKTTENFSIQSKSNITYNDNKIDVRFENPNQTKIESPLKFLAKDGEELMPEDIETFYGECKKWHKEKTGAEIYEG